ncbi:hypothetical protein ACFWJT_04795 [Streptomyces sp. NPDC127069]|uniref:hypothetical protein n=1 Tax=Streptomyces sp. NPDC127069 TaxID=3347128 RepID=UPI003667D2BA
MTVSVDGTARALSPGTDLAAYRIVQEALTKVTKHAAIGEAHVRLAYTGSRLRITFTNNGPARTTPATASSATSPPYANCAPASSPASSKPR